MPTAPPSRCTDPECHEIATQHGRCGDHQPKPWANRPSKYDRYGISSGEWRKLKKRVSRRDHRCCYRCGADQDDTGPDGEPFVLDHIIPISEGGSPRNLDNLGLLCPPCDHAKSADEARRGNQRRRARGKGSPS